VIAEVDVQLAGVQAVVVLVAGIATFGALIVWTVKRGVKVKTPVFSLDPGTAAEITATRTAAEAASNATNHQGVGEPRLIDLVKGIVATQQEQSAHLAAIDDRLERGSAAMSDISTRVTRLGARIDEHILASDTHADQLNERVTRIEHRLPTRASAPRSNKGVAARSGAATKKGTTP
jgi:hypothetical protein